MDIKTASEYVKVSSKGLEKLVKDVIELRQKLSKVPLSEWFDKLYIYIYIYSYSSHTVLTHAVPSHNTIPSNVPVAVNFILSTIKAQKTFVLVKNLGAVCQQYVNVIQENSLIGARLWI